MSITSTLMWLEKWRSDSWIIIAEKFGSAMSIVKTDIGGNITVRRIRSRCTFHIYASDWPLLQFMMPHS